MKLLISIAVFVGFLILGSIYIAEEDNTLEVELSQIKHPDTQKIQQLHEKFALLDMDAENFDLNKTIEEVNQARKLYPLDDELKMISIELNHKRANEAVAEID